MSDNVRKLSIALLLLAGVWVGVYWLWEPGEGRISFSKRGAAGAAVVNTAGGDFPPDPTIVEPSERGGAIGGSPGGGGESAGDSGVGRGSVVKTAPARVPEIPVGPDGKPIAVIPPEFVEYTVKAGDTLATISERVYGTRAHAAVVGRANPFMDPNRLKAGRVIRVPKDPKNVQGKPLPRPEPVVASQGGSPKESGGDTGDKTYTVKPGDTLSRIAQELYGSSGLGTFLYESNRSVLRSPDELKVGMKLRIPSRPTTGTGDDRGAR